MNTATADRSALQRVLSCRAMLDDLNKAVLQRQWQQAAQIAMEYSSLLRQMDVTENSRDMAAELVQLDIYHRRTMRLLSNKMKAVNEDIQSLEFGQKSARRSQAMAKTILGS